LEYHFNLRGVTIHDSPFNFHQASLAVALHDLCVLQVRMGMSFFSVSRATRNSIQFEEDYWIVRQTIAGE